MARWHLRSWMVRLALVLAAMGLAWAPVGPAQAPEGVALAAPVEAQAGRWIDVRLSEPTRVTAFEGNVQVYSALATKGAWGWDTPTGTFYIQRRVANERMVGPTWDVPNVLFTQYFTSAGHAIHYNYWSSNFGYAGSKGCLGMNYQDSLWFWNWATVGTPVVIHW